VEGKRFVGMVTLDDLLLDEATPLDQLAAIVQAQIGEGGLPASPRSPAMRRRTARAEATYGRLLNQWQADAALESAEEVDTSRAAKILAAAGRTIAQTVSAGQIKDMQSQLPEDLRGIFSDVRPAAA
jgi:hypothetical protein